MILLLDTHALLWWLGADDRLPMRVREHIEDRSVEVLASAASAWEISIKNAVGRLKTPPDLIDAAKATGLSWTAMEPEDAMAAGALPVHHRDPFDRMLIAQAAARGASLASRDRQLDAYGVARVWR